MSTVLARFAATSILSAMTISPIYAEEADSFEDTPEFSPVVSVETVTIDNYAVAETHTYMQDFVDEAGIGNIIHSRQPTPIGEQNILRMNRDTLYSFAVIDLTKPVKITKPDTSERFQSLQIINEEHSMLPVIHRGGEFYFTQNQVGSRYMVAIFRTFADPNDPEDIRAANAMQDRIEIDQINRGAFDIPNWNIEELGDIRYALGVLGATLEDGSLYFGNKDDLNPLYYLISTAVAWGGNPREAAMYVNRFVEQNDGETPYSVTVDDVPVDGFWSITVYNADGFMAPNDKGIHSYNNVTAEPNADGSFTINFGHCDDGRVNCIPIVDGWTSTVRMYEPRQELLEGDWVFPEFEAVAPAQAPIVGDLRY